jgi:hypothetical protein
LGALHCSIRKKNKENVHLANLFEPVYGYSLQSWFRQKMHLFPFHLERFAVTSMGYTPNNGMPFMDKFFQ